MADNTNTQRPTGQAQEDETLEEREARYKLRQEQREAERRERQRKGIE
jgi:hypothetical protein